MSRLYRQRIRGRAIGITLAMGMCDCAADLDDLDGATIVSLARSASYLEMPSLATAVEKRLCIAVDQYNCLSLLSLARVCVRLIVGEAYPVIAARDDFRSLPAHERHTLQRLHTAQKHFGLSPFLISETGEMQSPEWLDDRTLLAMMRESLSEQRDRYAHSVELSRRAERELRELGHGEDQIISIRS